MEYITSNETTNIYNKNFEFINNSFTQTATRGTCFKKDKINIWICDGELMTDKPIKNFNRYNLLKAQILSGNDNKKLLKEIKTYE